MERVRIAFADETLESLDEVARRRFDGDRDEAARALLDAWLDRRCTDS